MIEFLTNWCRICADDKSNAKIDIFTDSDTNLSILEFIKSCFNIMIISTDTKPQKICKKCFDILNNVKQLQSTAYKADRLYTEILNNQIKYEKNNYLDIPALREKIFIDDNILDTKTILNKTKNEDSIDERLMKTTNDIVHLYETYTSSDENDTKGKNSPESEDHLNISIKTEKNSITPVTIENESSEKDSVNLPDFIKCEKCDKVYTKRKSYIHHITTTHSNTRFFCSQCPKSYTSRNSLRTHENSHLPDNLKKNYICSFCNKKFSVAFTLRQHIKLVHINEREFTCDICGRNFKTKQKLQDHQLSHTDERPFQCPDCPKRFKSAFNLKIHSDHHSDTKYPCLKCNAIFNTKRSLTSHMVCHTEEKKHQCKVCGNEYKRFKALKYHMNSHTGHRYSCPYCDKTFADLSNSRKHQKSVHSK